jgi:hypothetical protein
MISVSDTRLIDLYGHSVSVIHKDKFNLVILFADQYHGQLVCTIPYESILYYDFKRGMEYHLQVELKGLTKVQPFGNLHTKNYLIVRHGKLLAPPTQK